MSIPCEHIHKVHSLLGRELKGSFEPRLSIPEFCLAAGSRLTEGTQSLIVNYSHDTIIRSSLDMEDNNTDDFEIAYAESIFSPEKC